MQSRFLKRASRAAAVVLAVILAIMLLLEFGLNTPYVRKFADKTIASALNAEASYSRLRLSLFRAFPSLSVSVEDFALTRIPGCPSLLDSLPGPGGMTLSAGRGADAGRGDNADTLLCLDGFSLAVNPWYLPGGRLKLSDARLEGLELYAHSSDSMLISASLDDLALKGSVRLGKPLNPRRMLLKADSLRVNGLLPTDTLAFSLDSLCLSQKRSRFSLGVNAGVLVSTRAYGTVSAPLTLRADLDFKQNKNLSRLDLHSLSLDLARIPLRAHGKALSFADSTSLSLDATIDSLALQPLMRDYLDRFIPAFKELDTDAILNVTLSSEGVYAEGRIPVTDVSISVPACSVRSRSLDTAGSLGLECNAHADEDASARLSVQRLRIDIPGLDTDLSAEASRLGGANPLFSVNGRLGTEPGRLLRFFPADTGLDASGSLTLDINGKASLSELKEYAADLDARLVSDTLSLKLGSDMSVSLGGLSARVGNSSAPIAGSDNFHPLEGRIDLGRLRFRSPQLRAGVVGMRNNLSISRSEYRGNPTPKLSVSSLADRLFVRSDDNRLALKNVNVSASALRRQRSASRREAVLDSLQKVYPDSPRDSLFARMRLDRSLNAQAPSKGDISVSLDTSVTKLLRQWSPSGRISVGGGFIAAPALPLRNTITGLDAGFDDNRIYLDSLGLVIGTSDLSARGSVSGLRKALRRRGPLKAELSLRSGRINAGELLAALQAGKHVSSVLSDTEDYEKYAESFVTDTLSDAAPDRDSIGAFILPSNLEIAFDLGVDRVDWSDLDISSFVTNARLKDRCLQLTDASLVTDAGSLNLDAFYSTPERKAISAGFNLGFKDITADRVISLVPSVDDLMPAIKSFKGRLNCTLTATSQLDSSMNVIIPSLEGVMRVSGTDLEIEDAGELRRITRLLLFKNKNIGHIDDLDVSAFIHDSRIEVFPFTLGIDRYKLAFCGIQGLDRQFNYHLSILRTPLPIRFGINMYGSPDKCHFNLCRARYRDGNVPVFTSQIDTMQINIVRSIRQIYRKGVNAAIRSNGKTAAEVERYKKTIGYFTPDGDSEFLSTAEYCQIDSVQFALEIEELDRQILSEVDNILDETFASAEELRRQFDDIFFDKKQLRRQEKAARREARRAARKKP
ncbi:MAG: hypothetical protein SOZ66_07790 [Candidatus Cryptobacteroides sp.]|nr:hypothetical protein [Candidatus Cryptobacteroides sp.]